MTKIVISDVRKAGLPEHGLEHPMQTVRADWRANWRRKHEARLTPALPCRQPFFQLPGAVHAQGSRNNTGQQ